VSLYQCLTDNPLLFNITKPQKEDSMGAKNTNTLEIYLESGKLRFEQTDITRKYLGAEEEHIVVHTPRVAVAV
jgi:hypothetical protein